MNVPWQAAFGILGILGTAGLFVALGASLTGKDPATADDRASPARAQVPPKPTPAAHGNPSRGGNEPVGAASSGSPNPEASDAALADELERLVLASDSQWAAFLARRGAVPATSEEDALAFVESLRRLSGHPRATVRRAAFLCLGRTPAAGPEDETTIPGLADSHPGVRREAVVAAARRGLGGRWRQLLPLLRDPDVAVRLAVAEALADVGHTEARAALRSLFLDPSDVVAFAAARALARQPAAAVSPEIVAAAGADDPRLRLAGARVLAHAHPPESLVPLKLLLDAPEQETRVEAVRGLVRIGGNSAALARAAVESVAFAPGRSRTERLVAFEGLATGKSEPTLDGILRVATQDPDLVVRVAAARTLLARGDRRGVPALIELRRVEPGPKCAAADRDLVRSTATEGVLEAARAGVAPAVALVGRDLLESDIQALRMRPEPEEVAALTRRVASEDAAAGLRLVAALAGRGGHACVRGLSDVVSHADNEVRTAALLGIARLGIRSDSTSQQVRAALSDRDTAVRTAALAATGAVGEAADVPALLDALSSDEREVVAAAYQGLRALTGARFAYRDGPWRLWWREASTAGPPALAQALARIESGGPPDVVESARALVERDAWIDVPATQAGLERWLDSSDSRLQAEALGLIARCRMGDLADRVSWSANLRGDPTVSDAALACAVSLGIRID